MTRTLSLSDRTLTTWSIFGKLMKVILIWVKEFAVTHGDYNILKKLGFVICFFSIH